jgi:hypothetical protein
VLVQVRRADGQPAIVDDRDLRVDVDRRRARAVPRIQRAGEEAAVAVVDVRKLANLAAALVVAALRM